MTRTKKSFAAAVAALALGASVFATSDAEARPRYRGAAIGAGFVGALALGAIAAGAASGPAYGYYDGGYEPAYAYGPVRRCHLVDRVNYYGEVIGTRRVCRTYY
jgi:hypothetical protein